MRLLALSTWVRYMHCCELNVPMPSGAYMGDYIQTIAQDFYHLKGLAYTTDLTVLLPQIELILTSNQEQDRSLMTCSLIEETISAVHFEDIKCTRSMLF